MNFNENFPVSMKLNSLGLSLCTDVLHEKKNRIVQCLSRVEFPFHYDLVARSCLILLSIGEVSSCLVHWNLSRLFFLLSIFIST